MTVVDFDVVNESNLNRQFFFRDQIGMKKVEALKENLLRIDPEFPSILDAVFHSHGQHHLRRPVDVVEGQVDCSQVVVLAHGDGPNPR